MVVTAQQVPTAPVDAANSLQGIKECIADICFLQQLTIYMDANPEANSQTQH